jgi:peptidoglycan/LPS O-acetylase OafA/YrhL
MTASTERRCAVHPARPAVDDCAVCARPRCAADAATHGGHGCAVCLAGRAERDRPAAPPASSLERLVRAALATLGAAVLGGLVAAQYVDAELFALLTPVVVGAGCGAAAQAASGGTRGGLSRGRTAQQVRAIGVVGGVLGVGLGFLLERSHDPLSPHAVVPTLLAVAGAVLWTLPPRAGGARAVRSQDGRAG